MGLADAVQKIEKVEKRKPTRREKMKEYVEQKDDAFWKKQMRNLDEHHEKYKNTAEYDWVMKREQMKFEREEAIFNWYRKILESPPELENQLLEEMKKEIAKMDEEIKAWKEMQVKLNV